MEDHSFFEHLPFGKRREVELQLDILNQTAPQINGLETKLVAARAKYQSTLTEQSDKLKSIADRLGKCIHRARPYYEARQQQAELVKSIQHAVERYNHANDALALSRETFAKLETSLITPVTDTGDIQSLDAINRCISQVNSARQTVMETKSEHEKLLEVYNKNESTIQQLERRHKMNIKKACPYFVTKQRLDQHLEEAKLHVDVCSEKVALCKSLYSEAMHNLEAISNALHRASCKHTRLGSPFTKPSALMDMLQGEESPPSCATRGQGVGAESVECLPEGTQTLEHTDTAYGTFVRNTLQMSALDLRSEPSMGMNINCSDLLQKQSHLIRYHSEPCALPLMDGLLRHVQQARWELGALQLTAAPETSSSSCPASSSASSGSQFSTDPQCPPTDRYRWLSHPTWPDKASPRSMHEVVLLPQSCESNSNPTNMDRVNQVTID